jgi:hypothetical protein
MNFYVTNQFIKLHMNPQLIVGSRQIVNAYIEYSILGFFCLVFYCLFGFATRDGTLGLTHPRQMQYHLSLEYSL